MCTLSETLKLCSCDAGSLGDLDHYWVFHRFVEGKDRPVVGRMLGSYPLNATTEAHNRALLLARLNRPDAFDVDLKPKDGDRLHLAFRITVAGKPETVTYGYALAGGTWVEQTYNSLAWERHHDRETFGEIRGALASVQK